MDGDRPGPRTLTAAPPPPPGLARRAAFVRLAALIVALLVAFAAFWIFDLVDRRDVRDVVDPFGWAAPVAYVLIAGLLGAALVPGPVLAGASGVLFGAAVGTVVTIAAAVLTTIVALLLARRAAGDAYATLAGPRMRALAALADRHGLAAVIVARLAPVLPDAPVSYLFGVMGLRVWVVALGTAIGVAPRAFSYTSIGASLDDPGSALGLAGIGGVIVTGVAGALLARRMLGRDRRRPDAAQRAKVGHEP